MVKIAEKAGLPCYLKPEQLCWYRDKSACRELLSKLGLPTPGFLKIPAAEQNEYKLAEITAGLKYPLISKPLDKYGSRGIFIIKDQEQLAGSVRKTAEFTDLQEILVEEYNDGFEFNMMTWVSDGKVNVISIADREKTQLPEGRSPSAHEMCIRDYCQKLKNLPRTCCSHIWTYRTEGRSAFHAVFLESREKESRSARLLHVFWI